MQTAPQSLTSISLDRHSAAAPAVYSLTPGSYFANSTILARLLFHSFHTAIIQR